MTAVILGPKLPSELVFEAVQNRKRSGLYVDCQQVRSIDRNLFFFKLKLLILIFFLLLRLCTYFFFFFFLVPHQVSNHLPFPYLLLTSLSSTPLHYGVQLRFTRSNLIFILLDSFALQKIGPRCVHVWLTSRFLTCNPVVVPLCKFGYNNI